MQHQSEAQVIRLGELAEVVPGYSPRPDERRPAGKYLLLGGRNVQNGRVVTTPKDTYIDELDKQSFQRAIAQDGDIILSTLFEHRKLVIYRRTDPLSVINNSCAIIRAPEANDYLSSYLQSPKGRDQFLREASAATAGAFIRRLSIHDLSRLEIPILPLADLQSVGDHHIASAPSETLLALRTALTKDAYIGELQRQLAALGGKDREVEKLANQIDEVIAYYENRLQAVEDQLANNDLRTKIDHGETAQLEFKSSLRWNRRAKRDDPVMEASVLKTIAAFCNTDGGELLIGVADDRAVLGIGDDHFDNDDKFLLHLTNLVSGRLLPSVVQYVKYKLVQLDDKTICLVTCKPSIEDVWLKSEQDELFYVRHGPSSMPLPPREATRYIRERAARIADRPTS